MGRVIPLLHEDGDRSTLASHVFAAYVGEQMGAEIRPRLVNKGESVSELLKAREAPWVLKILGFKTRPLWDLVEVEPHFVVVDKDAVLFMTVESRKDLKFSLLPRYIEKILTGFDHKDWEAGLNRVKAGEGVRKVALDMLREADLI